MPNQRYFPTKESEQVQWLNNYRNKLPTHGPTTGITAPEIAETIQDILFAVYLIENWYPAIQQDAQEATAYKRMVLHSPASGLPTVVYPTATVFSSMPTERPPGVFKRLFSQVVRIKGSLAYTPAMGEDMQIIGQEDAAEHLTPEFSATVMDWTGGQMVRLKFTKFGHDGVSIECRRNGSAWNFLAHDLRSPYDDKQALLVANTPETREYRISFWDGGDQNGDWSPVKKVTVGA